MAQEIGCWNCYRGEIDLSEQATQMSTGKGLELEGKYAEAQSALTFDMSYCSAARGGTFDASDTRGPAVRSEG